MRVITRIGWIAGAAFALAFTGGAALAQRTSELRPPSDFTGIADAAARSRALFTESAKVITHPRCMNCHPASNRPLQGDDQHLHQPPVPRGDGGLGVAGNPCSA